MTVQNASISLALSASLAGANQYGGPFWSGALSLIQPFSDGVVAGKFDRFYLAERTVLTAANDDIDLSGSLTDVFGNVISAVELVALVILNKPLDPTAAPNTTNLTIGGGSNPVTVGFLGGTTPTIGPIRPGGFVALMNPDASGLGAITGGSGDILRVANSAGVSCKYQIAAAMRSS
jgi:hypothetical protein